jgi:hypothetical protein
MSLPLNYAVAGCDHGDIDVHHIPATSTHKYSQNLAHVMQSPNETQYKMQHKQMGISKPSLFSGLPTNWHLPIPGCFPADLMHLVSLNLRDLLINLWCGNLDCNQGDNHDTWDWAVLKGEIWQNHGK